MPLVITAPSTGWRLISANSLSVRRPGLLRMSRGVCSLPMSCSAAAVRTLATSAAGSPIAVAIRSAWRVTRCEWP